MSVFYKYNSSLNVWETFEPEGPDGPSDMEYETYGTDDIHTDEGLPNAYKILFKTPESFIHDEIPNNVEVNITPPGQFISYNCKQNIEVTKIIRYKYIDTTRNPIPEEVPEGEEEPEHPWDKTATFQSAINIDSVSPDVDNPLDAYDYNVDIRHMVDPRTEESYIRINTYVVKNNPDANRNFKMFKIVIG